MYMWKTIILKISIYFKIYFNDLWKNYVYSEIFAFLYFNKFLFNVILMPFFEQFKRRSDFISFQSSYKWYSFYSTCLHGALCSVKLIGWPKYVKNWCVTDYTKHVRNVRIKTLLKMQHSKTGKLYWSCDRVTLWTCRRKRLPSPYVQMVLTFQIYPGTIKLIQSDNIAEENISENRICSLTTNYSQNLPSPWLFSLLVATDVYSQLFK